MTQLPNDLMTTFLDLCNPFCYSLSSIPSEEGWDYISQLSKPHGVTAFFFYRTRSLGIPLPDRIKKEWLGYYLYNLAQEQRAHRQIKELKEILDPEGIPMILLKGASAMMRLYPEPGLRTFVDLDILIPADRVPQFKKAMTMAGYKPLSARNSPEDEELQKFELHLDPYRKEGEFGIEPHLSILKGRGQYSIALPEIWRDKEETNTGGIDAEHLNTEHFIIHSLLHCTRDLHDGGFIEIKGLIDTLYAINIWRTDWSKIIDISQRWGVKKDILPLVSTLNHYWQAGIPLPMVQEPLALNILVLGEEDREKQCYANLPAGYLKRFLKVRELPSVASQVRYALHLFFPTRQNLRWRYRLSSEESLTVYYLLHPLLILRNFSKGLWFRLMIKTK